MFYVTLIIFIIFFIREVKHLEQYPVLSHTGDILMRRPNQLAPSDRKEQLLHPVSLPDPSLVYGGSPFEKLLSVAKMSDESP